MSETYQQKAEARLLCSSITLREEEGTSETEERFNLA